MRLEFPSPIPPLGWPGQKPVEEPPIPHVGILSNPVEADDSEFWELKPEQLKEIRKACRDLR